MYGRLQSSAIVTSSSRARLPAAIVSLGKHTPRGCSSRVLRAEQLLPLHHRLGLAPAVLPLPSLRRSGAFLAHFDTVPWTSSCRHAEHRHPDGAEPTLAVAVAVCFSWVVLRSKLPPARLRLHRLPAARRAEHAVRGVGAALRPVRAERRVTRSLWILCFVFVIARISYAPRMTNAGLIQMPQDLEEAATMSGVSTGVTVRRVHPAAARADADVRVGRIALLTFRELSLASS